MASQTWAAEADKQHLAASCPTYCAAEVGQRWSGEVVELGRILGYESTKAVQASRHMKALSMPDMVEP